MKTNSSILIISLSITILLIFISCVSQKNDFTKNIPTCIKNEIAEIKAEKARNPPSGIWQYEYNGQTVYYISPRCCDMPSKVVDKNCNKICSPDGGITGMGDGKCTDFFTKKTNEKLIWQDDRK